MTRRDYNRAGFSQRWMIALVAIICMGSFAFSSSNQGSEELKLNGSWDQTLGHFREGESALEFSLVLNETNVPPSPQLSFSESLTLEAWIKPNGWGGGPNYIGTILYKPSIWIFIIQDHPSASDRSLIFQLRHNDGVSHSFSPVGSIVLDVWTHLAVSYSSATSEARIHINGIEQEISYIVPPSGPIRNNSSEGFELGSLPQGMMNFMGVIDEVRIWNDVRSPGEIFHNMNSMLNGDETGLQLYWPMNEGGGDSLHDMSGNGHDIRISGVDWTFGTPFYPTSIADPIPAEVIPELLINTYPNPFNPTLTIQTELWVPADLQIRVYNSTGQQVWSKSILNQSEGKASFMWNGLDDSGAPASSGVYIITVATPEFMATQKNVLLR
ncbi:MAG: T9SS type A sorting domain-containing protein [FCB group bacterium]|nr:T9SS type A sorting domain-containing protein [FCB group bacterium]MBL7120971.1 T9SS type A sorting domain-containing protein [Candidatus Neomarinimicrobiota bacterium]